MKRSIGDPAQNFIVESRLDGKIVIELGPSDSSTEVGIIDPTERFSAPLLNQNTVILSQEAPDMVPAMTHPTGHGD